MITLSPLVLQIVSLGLTYTPQLIEAAIAEIDLLNSGSTPTAEQLAVIAKGLEEAHAALQNS